MFWGLYRYTKLCPTYFPDVPWCFTWCFPHFPNISHHVPFSHNMIVISADSLQNDKEEKTIRWKRHKQIYTGFFITSYVSHMFRKILSPFGRRGHVHHPSAAGQIRRAEALGESSPFRALPWEIRMGSWANRWHGHGKWFLYHFLCWNMIIYIYIYIFDDDDDDVSYQQWLFSIATFKNQKVYIIILE